VIVISARTAQALARAKERVAATLAAGEVALADVAATLHTGRKVFAHRVAVAARDLPEAATALAKARPGAMAADRPRVVFLFPGQGTQRPGVGTDLYRGEPVYGQPPTIPLSRCYLKTGLDLRDLRTPTARAGGEDAYPNSVCAAGVIRHRLRPCRALGALGRPAGRDGGPQHWRVRRRYPCQGLRTDEALHRGHRGA
jgi:hypothetical protein